MTNTEPTGLPEIEAPVMPNPTPEALVAKWRSEAFRMRARASERDSNNDYNWAEWVRDEMKAGASAMIGCAVELEASLAASKAEPVGGEAVAWLSKDDAQLALLKAIQAIKLGNPTDDKLILANLREAGLWIGRYEAAPVAAAPVVDPSRLGAAMKAFDDAGGHAVSYAPAWMRKALEAASTPAAPADLDAHGLRALDNCIADLRRLLELAQDYDLDVMQMQSLETAIESMELRKAASTPAAPGIDLEQFRALVSLGMTYGPGSRYRVAAEGLCALIDASPKGGSDAASELRIWGTQKPGSMPKLFGVRHIAELNWYPDEGHDLVCMQVVERVQATSAEVGA